MTMKLYTKLDSTTSKWSGGTTTELIIGPKGSNYKEREFGFRISTATVEVETSEFTPLPGVTRYIMSLEGDLKLVHNDEYIVELEPYQVECFPGDWQTKSEGKVVDFNLMLKGDAKGNLKGVMIDGQGQLNQYLSKKGARTYLYSKDSSFKVINDDKIFAVKPGELLEIIDEDPSTITVLGDSMYLVVAEVRI